MTEEQLFDKVRELALEGKDAFFISQEMSRSINPEDPIQNAALHNVLKKVDDYVVSYQLALQEKGKVLNSMIIGGVFLMIGLGFTLSSLLMDGDEFILAYGAILLGSWMLKQGYKEYRRPIESFMPRRGKFIRR